MRKKTFQSEDKNVLSQPACLNRIYRSINSQGFTEETIQELRADIDYISGIYRTKEVGAVLLAAILEKSATDHLMDDEDLASYLGCTNIEFIRYHTDLCEMDKTGIIQLWGRGPRCSYRVTPETMRAVESNGEFKPVKLSGLTAEEFFTRLRKLFGSFRNDSINADRLLQELDSLINLPVRSNRSMVGAGMPVSSESLRLLYPFSSRLALQFPARRIASSCGSRV